MKPSIKFMGLADPTTLRPNPWNTNTVSPENEKKIEASIQELSMFKPIVVRETGGFLEILGGQHRWEAARRLGYTEVPVVNLGAVDDMTAKKIGLVDNGRYGADDTIGLAELLKEIGLDDVASIMPYTDLELTAILDASSISLDDIGLPTDIDDRSAPEPKPAPSFQIMRFKVPVEDVAAITQKIEKTMRGQNFTSEDSLTNAGNALVHLLLKGE